MMRDLTRHRVLLHIGSFALALLGAAAARAADTPVRNEAMTAAVATNQAITLREHAGWDAACEAVASPVLMLDAPPQHGRVCARVETITIRSLYAGTEDQCIGRHVRGVRLEYRPDAGFSGGDALRYAVQYPSVRRAIAVSVSVGTQGAAQPIAALPSPPRQPAGPVPPCTDLIY